MGAQRFGWTSILAGLLFALALIAVIEFVERSRSGDSPPALSDASAGDEPLLDGRFPDEPFPAPFPDEPLPLRSPPDAVTANPVFATDIEPPDPLAEGPTPASRTYIRPSAFTGGPQIPAAIRADEATARDVLDALGVPVATDVFTPAFYDHRLFDRMIAGDLSDIGQLKLPKQIEHVLLLRLSEPQRSTAAGNSAAITLTTTVEGAVIDVPARTVELLKFEAAGVGRDDDRSLRASLRDDMAPRLEPLRTNLTSRAGM